MLSSGATRGAALQPVLELLLDLLAAPVAALGASLLALLQYLPLRADELKAAGSPEIRPDKAPLFIERLVMRKQSPDKPDEVRLSLRAVGFVFRE